ERTIVGRDRPAPRVTGARRDPAGGRGGDARDGDGGDQQADEARAAEREQARTQRGPGGLVPLGGVGSEHAIDKVSRRLGGGEGREGATLAVTGRIRGRVFIVHDTPPPARGVERPWRGSASTLRCRDRSADYPRSRHIRA